MMQGNKWGDTLFRIGFGYDVHRLREGRPLILGGVDIPHNLGLDGYSDADVLIHAICDALLGAAALKDIGHLFPDDGPEWEGVESTILLQKVGNNITKRGYEIGNIDSTIIADKPRMKEHLPEMVDKIAGTLQIDPHRVNIKATTQEGLGYIGKGEGIAVQAVCLISQTD